MNALVEVMESNYMHWLRTLSPRYSRAGRSSSWVRLYTKQASQKIGYCN
jgi:hypothetical protein